MRSPSGRTRGEWPPWPAEVGSVPLVPRIATASWAAPTDCGPIEPGAPVCAAPALAVADQRDEPPVGFRDEQVTGAGGPLGALLDRLAIRRQLREIFDFRRRAIAAMLEG